MGRVRRSRDPTRANQVDQLRAKIANVEGGLEVVMTQLARLPKRGDIWCAVVMGMVGGSVLTTALAFLLR